MADILNPSVWQESDAANTSGTQPSFPEFMPAEKLNNGARAMMGAIKRAVDQLCATRTTSGTGSAYLVSYTIAPELIYNGQRFCVVAHVACSAAPTININSLGAKEIRKITSGGVTALGAGDIPANAILDLVYVEALNLFLWINSPTTSSGGVTSHTHPQSEIVNLVTDLAAKASIAYVDAAVAAGPGSSATQNAQTANYTLVASDASKMVTFNAASGVNCVVNTGIFSSFKKVEVIQLGAGLVTFTGTATRLARGSASSLIGQYSHATLWFLTANSYVLYGDLATGP